MQIVRARDGEIERKGFTQLCLDLRNANINRLEIREIASLLGKLDKWMACRHTTRRR
jgi:hypothetical protein